MSRLHGLLPVAALAAACASTPFSGGVEGACVNVGSGNGGAALTCNQTGELVACTGQRALTRKGGLHVCTEIEDAGYMLVCARDVRSGRFEVELLPCAACPGEVDGLGLVDFQVDACRLPAQTHQVLIADEAAEDSTDPLTPDLTGTFDETGGEDTGNRATVGASTDEDSDAQDYASCPCVDGFVCDEDLQVCVRP